MPNPDELTPLHHDDATTKKHDREEAWVNLGVVVVAAGMVILLLLQLGGHLG